MQLFGPIGADVRHLLVVDSSPPKLTVHPKANVLVSIGERKGALPVHRAVFPLADVDIAIYPCVGAFPPKLAVRETTDVQRMVVGRPTMSRTLSPSLIKSPSTDGGVTIIGFRQHWPTQHQNEYNCDYFLHSQHPTNTVNVSALVFVDI